MGTFLGALEGPLAAYQRTLSDVVMYDRSACSLVNASAIRDRNLGYVLSQTDNRATLLAAAHHVLGKVAPERCQRCNRLSEGASAVNCD